MSVILKKTFQPVEHPPRLAPIDSTPIASFNARSCFVKSAKDLPLIADVFSGNVKGTEQLFFPVKKNKETELIYRVVCEMIEDKTQLESHFDAEKNDYVIKFKSLTFNLYETLRKVKWDLISFDNKILNKVTLHSKFAQPPTCKDSNKTYLYTKLHRIEKIEIGDYSSWSGKFNTFLREPVNRNMIAEEIANSLQHVALLCSGLNKIPVSKSVEKSGSVYRCINNAVGPGNKDLIDYYRNQLADDKKDKEYGFTGVSYDRPLQGFLSYGSGRDCVKIYLNPGKLAKDISGISHFPLENECLFLPNTKDLLLREVSYFKGSEQTDNSKRHLFLTRLISKRQQVF